MSIKRWVRDMMSAGYTVEKTRGQHFKITRTDKPGVVYAASTPGDYRATKNLQASLRRMFGSEQ